MNPVKTKSLTKIAFKTLGCKLNFAETEQIAKKFNSDIYMRVDPNDVARTMKSILYSKTKFFLVVPKFENSLEISIGS